MTLVVAMRTIFAFLATVRPEIDSVAVDLDKDLATGFVEAVLGDTDRHARRLSC